MRAIGGGAAAGSWGQAIEVPGLGALGKVDASDVNSVSYASAIKLPGLAALNKGGFAKVNSVSCAPAGNCAAGGLYSWRGGFVAAEQNGSWGKAIKVPGLNAPNAGHVAEVVSVSCASVSLTALTAS